MRNSNLVFLAVVALASLFMAAYDLWLIRDSGGKTSVSEQLLAASHRYPMIPLCVGLLVGVLLGHLFWEHRAP